MYTQNTEKKMIEVYEADSNLMYNSYEIIAICDSKHKAIELLTPRLEMASIENFKQDGYCNSNQMLRDLIYSLKTIEQTQSLEKNYVFENFNINELNN